MTGKDMYFVFQNINSLFIVIFVLLKAENFKIASKYKENLLKS